MERDGVVLSVQSAGIAAKGKPGAQAYFVMAAAHPRSHLGGGNRILSLQILAVLGVSWSLLGTWSESKFQAPKEEWRHEAQVLRTVLWDMTLIFKGKKGLDPDPATLNHPIICLPRQVLGPSPDALSPLCGQSCTRTSWNSLDSLLSLFREVPCPWPGN